MNLADIEREDRRLRILKVLVEADGYAINDAILKAVLKRQYAHTVSRDVLRADIAWLHEQGLVEARDIDGAVAIALITARGMDVAEGAATVPGVKHPRPGE